MKKLFSEKMGFTAPLQVNDEAPAWLREALFMRAIVPFLRFESGRPPSGALYEMEMRLNKPISCSVLIEHIALANQQSAPENYLSPLNGGPVLRTLLLSLDWGHFYDVIELISEWLTEVELNTGLEQAKQFQTIVNNSFAVGNVNWTLEKNNSLQRVRPEDILMLEKDVSGSDVPYARHLEKAKSFLNKRPADAANAIKESVSALESFARTDRRNCKTLGDVVKALRNDPHTPQLILDVITKLYAFATAEPGVRHGFPSEERVERNDAEFAYITSMASIRYLQGKSK